MLTIISPIMYVIYIVDQTKLIIYYFLCVWVCILYELLEKKIRFLLDIQMWKANDRFNVRQRKIIKKHTKEMFWHGEDTSLKHYLVATCENLWRILRKLFALKNFEWCCMLKL